VGCVTEELSDCFTQIYVTETHVKPGIMEHLEQLSSQFTNTQQQFIAYKNRLNVVRTTKEQLHVEGKHTEVIFTK
jgi:4-aminobutyrate aminotransferase-like enzyme